MLHQAVGIPVDAGDGVLQGGAHAQDPGALLDTGAGMEGVSEDLAQGGGAALADVHR